MRVGTVATTSGTVMLVQRFPNSSVEMVKGLWDTGRTNRNGRRKSERDGRRGGNIGRLREALNLPQQI